MYVHVGISVFMCARVRVYVRLYVCVCVMEDRSQCCILLYHFAYVCMYVLCVCLCACVYCACVCVCVCVRKCEMSRILLLTCKFTEALYVDCFAVHSNRKWTLVWTEARQWSCHKALACGDGKYMPIDCV